MLQGEIKNLQYVDNVDPVYIVESTPNGPVVHKFYGEIKVMEKSDA
jgi:hypothetical protein